MQVRVQLLTVFGMAALLLSYEVIPWDNMLEAALILLIAWLSLATVAAMLRRWGYR